jgi:SNF2 family DNA or RNA helicase
MNLAEAAAHDAVAMFGQLAQPSPYQLPAYREPPRNGYYGDGALRGEMTADGRHMVLWATGSAHDKKNIAERLHLLTAAGESALDENGQPTGARYYPLSWATVVQLGFIYNHDGRTVWKPWPRLTEWIIAETIRRTSPPPPVDLSYLPAGLAPRHYQADGAAAIASAGKFLLGDDPGTGKTVTTLCGIEARRRAGTDIFPMVITVPSWEVARVWEDHIRTWMPHWPEPVLHRGPKRARVQGWKHGQYILITTYATLRRDAPDMRGLLVKIRAKAVIADECHLARNPKAKQSKALWRVAHYAPTMVWASGTLVTHDFGDIYQPLFTMAPLDFPSKEDLKKRYLAIRRGNGEYDETILGLRPEMEAEFFAVLAGQLRRVAKADVLTELPEKIYSVRRPEMPPEWRRAYDTMEAQMLAELPDGEELPVMSILEQLTRLSQLASSAADVATEYKTDERTGLLVPHYTVTLKPPCWKADALLDYLAERPDQPTAVFAESRQLAMITGEYCRKAGLRTGYVAGTGDSGEYGEPGVRITNSSRRAAVEDFQAGKLDVILCTLGAGGLGITLTASNSAAMLQRSYQFDLAIQPEDRVHRIGAEIHDHVEITDFVTVGTVDQRRREVLRDRAGQLGQLVRDPRIVRQLLGGAD